MIVPGKSRVRAFAMRIHEGLVGNTIPLATGWVSLRCVGGVSAKMMKRLHRHQLSSEFAVRGGPFNLCFLQSKVAAKAFDDAKLFHHVVE